MVTILWNLFGDPTSQAGNVSYFDLSSVEKEFYFLGCNKTTDNFLETIMTALCAAIYVRFCSHVRLHEFALSANEEDL